MKKVIERLFKVQFNEFNYDKYHPDLPQPLKEMYEIDALFSQDCSYDTIHFFCNQDRLIKYNQLKLSAKSFVFVHENQYNWTCEAALKSDKVYFNNSVEPEKSHYLNSDIGEFLTTFGLQEIGFNLSFYFGLENQNMDETKANFQKVEHLWTDTTYLYNHPYSYYLVDDDCLVMWAGMCIFATNNETKFKYYQSVLKHYTF